MTERIGFIGVTLSSGLGLRRFQGYLDALREHGLPIDEKLIVGKRKVDEQVPGYSTEAMGYEGMKQRETKSPANGKIRLTETVERLVQLYNAWGKEDEAAKWRKKLQEVKGAQ